MRNLSVRIFIFRVEVAFDPNKGQTGYKLISWNHVKFVRTSRVYQAGGCRLGPNGPKPAKTRDHASIVFFSLIFISVGVFIAL